MEKKTGIVLSGGAVRGFAHLGVLKALNEHDIYPDIISGVSAGAVVGAFYAEGHTPEEILEIFLHKKMQDFLNMNFSKGFASMKKFEKRIEEHLDARAFEDLRLKLVISATNLNSAKLEQFSSGKLIDKIIASSSVPILFKPYKIDDHYYVDGGVMDNMPMDPIADQCDFIIGVNVNPLGYRKDFSGLLEIADRTFNLILVANFIKKKDEFDLYIEPDKLEDYSLFKLKQAEDIFNIGYEYTMKILDDKNLNN